MAEGLGGAIEAGKAFVEFLLEDKQFTGKLGQIGQKLSKVGKIGVLATAPLIAALTTCVYVGTDFAAELADMSYSTGISADALSRLGFIAGEFNVQMEDVGHSVRKMQEQLADIGPGGEEFRKTVRGLGLNLEELRKQSPDEQFVTLAAAIGDLEDPTLRAYAAQKLFGKSGIETMRVLKGGREAFLKAAADAKRLGVIIRKDEVEANDALGTSLGIVRAQLRALGTHISADIAGPLTKLTENIQNVLAWLNEFVVNHPRVVQAIAAVAGVTFTFASALYAVGKGLEIIENVFKAGAIMKALSWLWKIVVVIGEALAAVAAAVDPIVWAITAAFAAIAGLIYWFSPSKANAKSAGPSTLPQMQRVQATQPRVGGVIASPTSGSAGSYDAGGPMATSSTDVNQDYFSRIADATELTLQYLRYGNPGFVGGTG